MSITQQVLAALSEHHMSARECAEEIGAPVETVAGIIGSLRVSKPGLIVIRGWIHRPSVGRLNLVAQYGIGPGKDAKKPERMSASQRCKAWRERRKGRVASVFHLPSLMDRKPLRKAA